MTNPYPWLPAVKPADVSHAAHEAYIHATEPAALYLLNYAYPERQAHIEEAWEWVLERQGERITACAFDRRAVPVAWANDALKRMEEVK